MIVSQGNQLISFLFLLATFDANLQGYIAVADRALIDSTGKQIACFLIPLDRPAIPNMSALRDALSSVTSEVSISVIH